MGELPGLVSENNGPDLSPVSKGFIRLETYVIASKVTLPTPMSVLDGSSSKVSVLTTVAAWKKACGSVTKVMLAYAVRADPPHRAKNRTHQETNHDFDTRIRIIIPRWAFQVTTVCPKGRIVRAQKRRLQLTSGNGLTQDSDDATNVVDQSYNRYTYSRLQADPNFNGTRTFNPF